MSRLDDCLVLANQIPPLDCGSDKNHRYMDNKGLVRINRQVGTIIIKCGALVAQDENAV